MAVVKSYIGLDGLPTTKNPFPKAVTGQLIGNTKNTYAAGTRENIAFNANFGNNDIYGFSRQRDTAELQRLTAEMTNVKYAQPIQEAAPAPVQQQVAKAIPKETPGTGANRGAVGSLGRSSGAGVAGSAQAGLVGSVNTEVQNDDELLPYQKV